MAVISLALGVGLNTTLFSVVNAVLLRNTPVQAPERLVEIYSNLSDEFPYLTTSYPDYLSIRDGADAFSGVAAHAFVRGILSTGGTPVLITGETITPNYFDVLGVRPALGRGLRADENVGEGQHAVVVLSHGLWQRRFGGRSDILGSAVELSGVKYTVVGVSASRVHGHGAGAGVAVLGPGDDGRPLQLPGHPERGGPRPGRDPNPEAGAALAAS